jgi:hypothetical protein
MPQPEQDNHIIDIVLAIATMAGVVWLVWPEMKINNIFKKSPFPQYAIGKAEKRRQKHTAVDGLLVCITMGLAEMLSFFSGGLHLSSYHHHHQKNPYISSCTLFIGLYVYSFTTDSDFSQIRNFQYVGRSWLTSLLVCTVTAFVFFKPPGFYEGDAMNYFITIALTLHRAGLPVLIVMLYMANRLSTKDWIEAKKKKIMILLSSLTLAVTAALVYIRFSFAPVLIISLQFSVVLLFSLLQYKMEVIEPSVDEPDVETIN